MGTEEAFDVGQLCRGFLATVNGWNMSGQQALKGMAAVEMCVVVDAKDVHDKGNSDTPSYGSQKSLPFTVAWLRSQLKQPGTSLKWTSTENMWADGGAKLMDLTHMRRIMASGEWSVKYCPDFVKQVSKAAKAKPVKLAAGAELPGEAVSGGDELLPHLTGLSDKRGWHFQAGVGIQVAVQAKSFRTPAPRFSVAQFPFRSSFGRFEHSTGQCEWRRLEACVKLADQPNQHAMIGCTVPVLITLFHAEPDLRSW